QLVEPAGLEEDLGPLVLEKARPAAALDFRHGLYGGDLAAQALGRALEILFRQGESATREFALLVRHRLDPSGSGGAPAARSPGSACAGDCRRRQPTRKDRRQLRALNTHDGAGLVARV